MPKTENNPFRPPTDAEIAEAEAELGLKFHRDYRAFLKGGGDVANACFEPAVILEGSGNLDLFEIAETAWNDLDVPRDWLPFVEDNGDYYCINPRGEVVFWSHNGGSEERWRSMADWYEKVCVNGE